MHTRQIHAQSIKGSVTDDKGIGLPGGSVVVKGTTVGTVTDPDGFYVIGVQPGATLTFSFIGYMIREIEVAWVNLMNHIEYNGSCILCHFCA